MTQLCVTLKCVTFFSSARSRSCRFRKQSWAASKANLPCERHLKGSTHGTNGPTRRCSGRHERAIDEIKRLHACRGARANPRKTVAAPAKRLLCPDRQSRDPDWSKAREIDRLNRSLN